MATDGSMHFADVGAQLTTPDRTAGTLPKIGAASLHVATQDGSMLLSNAMDAIQNAILARDLASLQAGIGDLVRHIASAPGKVAQLDKVSHLLADPNETQQSRSLGQDCHPSCT